MHRLYLFFILDTTTTYIYTLSLHDALPILFFDDAKVAAKDLGLTLTSRSKGEGAIPMAGVPVRAIDGYLRRLVQQGRSEGTRLNSSHSQISYAVFCLKKKKKISSITPDFSP